MLIPICAMARHNGHMNFTSVIKVTIASVVVSVGGLVGVTGVASAASTHPASCSYFDTGRITCRYSSGSRGSYSYSSFNSRTGYSSFGSRSTFGSSSFGSMNYSSPSSWGSRSYSSSGLGSGLVSRTSTGWNSNRGYWSSTSSRFTYPSTTFSTRSSSLLREPSYSSWNNSWNRR